MKNYIRILFLFCIVLTLTSCFDIIDKINMKADGSGEYSLILNASKSKTRLQSISKMGTFNGKKIPKPSEIEQKVNAAASVFRSVPGISNVQTSMDFNQYIIKLSCKFKKIENINAGIAQLKTKKIIGQMVPTQLYSYNASNRQFLRNKLNSFKEEYEKLPSSEKDVLANAQYTSVIQFENIVKSQSNNIYSLAPSKKAVKLDGIVLDFIMQKKNVQNSIQLQ